MKLHTPDYRITPGAKVNLRKWKTDDDGGWDKDAAKSEFKKVHKRLVDLQEVLYAQGNRALLVVLQAMDTAGKDSTIRQVFGGINPQGCKVTSFKAPNVTELAHDYLWRIHQNTPRLGMVGVFNRSHYEDVLIVRVKNLVPEKRWKKRYDHINCFERMLHDEGTAVVKFHLHISKAYQKTRLQKRLDDPAKHWKFDPGDLVERARWDQYMLAYQDALERCSTEHAPWYIVPAEKRWFRNLLIARVLVQTLEDMDLHYPKATFDAGKIRIPD